MREVNLRKGVIQPQYNPGPIILSTTAHGDGTRTGGVLIRDVENPDDVYQTH